jgi:hypothetical protein
MKADAKPSLRFRIKTQYSTAFVGVARSIANTHPPLWLLVGLTHFSDGIGNDTSKHKQFTKDITGKMSEAAALLLRWLPMYERAGYGLQCPDEIKAVLALLPKIKADLDQLSTPSEGRPKNVRREICAAVVVEAWRLGLRLFEKLTTRERCGSNDTGIISAEC